jgi:hypothetical protein
MPTNPEALEDFLTRQPEPHFVTRDRGEVWLRDVIHRTTGIEWRPKIEWRGDDRDLRQLEAIAFALITKQALVYYPPQLGGKTRIALDWLQHLVRAGLIGRALIIPHSPLGLDEWVMKIPLFCDLQFSIVRSGPGVGDELVAAIERSDNGIIITGSTLQAIFAEKREIRRGSRQGAQKLYADRAALRLVSPIFSAIVVDEIQQSNDVSSLRFDILSTLAPDYEQPGPPWRLGLTGTPFGRNPFALWSQARIVDGGRTLSRSYPFFTEAFGRRVYNHFSRTKDELIFDAKKMPLLRAKMDHLVIECQREDIRDVDLVEITVELRMLHEQARAYRDLIGEMIEERRGETESSRVMRTKNIFIRLRQVASGYRVFTDGDGLDRTVVFPSAKLEWLEQFLTTLDMKLKIVIFHEFVASGARICEMLKKLKIKHTWLWGGSPDKRDAKDQFQLGDVPVLVANHATGGVGITLSSADYVCIYESPVGAIGRKQMQARSLARGDAPLVIDDLVCAPVEKRILDFHREAREVADMFAKPRELAELLR